MTHDIWITVWVLGFASLAIRLFGFLLAQRLPQTGAWARGMEALPGCLIVALVALMILNSGQQEWIAGAVVLLIAAKTRNLPLSMAVGVAVVAFMRATLP
ncbi:AzlD family protein [Epibacterium ulvae]|uniref:AzlD family protein n=1 Tax=Epibacterium ulvae TaxID=1156985 RepID=UPI002490A522|nr:AzlD domain-containing protein [Epibacterium ulvae]